MDKPEILKLRRDKKLHPAVEDRLTDLFKKVTHGNYTQKEGYGVTSGRTDTTTFSGRGQIIHIEFIASESMVSRDLLNLHQSSADEGVVVLMDEEIDPKVAKAYYSANAKDAFPRIWLSDVLNETRESYVLGRLDEIVQSVERDAKEKHDQATEKISTYLDNLEKKENYIEISFGMFPRKKIDVFGKTIDERELFDELNPLGVTSAAAPHGSVGLSWDYTQGGKYFTMGLNNSEGNLIPYLSVGAEGEVIYTFRVNKERFNEIAQATIEETLLPTIDFFVNLAEHKGYDGMVDVTADFKGLKDLKWVKKEDSSPIHRVIRGRVFYENEIRTDVETYSVEDLKDSGVKEKLFESISTVLHRNSRSIRWKA